MCRFCSAEVFTAIKVPSTENDIEIDAGDHHFSNPSSAGRYIYEVFAKWPDGGGSYIFIEELENLAFVKVYIN